MKDDEASFPGPSCGFEVFSSSPGFRRASAWWPLVATEMISPRVPTGGSDYFAQAYEDAPPYYWHRMAFERVYIAWDADPSRSERFAH
jgi:hypothetical protein